MINANQLRIGNWVYDSECEPHYFQVEQLTKYVGSELWIVYRNGTIKVKEAQPIPLTEDLLLKCGFEKVPSTQYDDKNAYEIKSWGRVVLKDGILYSDEYYFLTGLNTDIQYLHQLQNLFFALTNTELNITL